jgi:hypothetical protein
VSDRLRETRQYLADQRERRRVETVPNLLDRDTWQSPASATTEWRAAMLEQIRHVAQGRPSFTVEDLRIPPTVDKRAVGAVLLTASRRGWIVSDGYVTGGPTRHGRPVTVWHSKVYQP